MEELLNNTSRIHTTTMGEDRIKKNLGIINEPLEYCIDLIKSPQAQIERKGKNWYINSENVIITINAHSYTIITAHKV